MLRRIIAPKSDRQFHLMQCVTALDMVGFRLQIAASKHEVTSCLQELDMWLGSIAHRWFDCGPWDWNSTHRWITDPDCNDCPYKVVDDKPVKVFL